MSGFKYTKALIVASIGLKWISKYSKIKKPKKNIFKILESPMKSKSSTPRE